MKQIRIRIWKDIKKYRWPILGFLIYYGISHYFWGAYCPMLLITGIPCPGCGMSRAIFFVFTMQFSRAWAMNPIAFLWAPFLLLFFIVRYVLGKRVKKMQGLLIAILFATILYYCYRMLFVFPASPPMVYRYNNLLHLISLEYDKIINAILY